MNKQRTRVVQTHKHPADNSKVLFGNLEANKFGEQSKSNTQLTSEKPSIS